METILVCDGVSYCCNAGTLVRNAVLLGVKTIHFCPLDAKRFDIINQRLNNRPKNKEKKDEKKEEKEEKEKEKEEDDDEEEISPFNTFQLKNFAINPDGSIRYTKYFRTNLNKFSFKHDRLIEIKYNSDIQEIVNKALSDGYTIYKLENTGNPKHSIYNAKLDQKKVMLIVGNETVGISYSILENQKIIPLYIPSQISAVDSYNVASAANIACYERSRYLQN